MRQKKYNIRPKFKRIRELKRQGHKSYLVGNVVYPLNQGLFKLFLNSREGEWLDNLLFEIKWHLSGPGERFKDVRREMRLAHQRATTGIDDSMTWSLDSYLIDHMGKLLKQYHEHAKKHIVMDDKFTSYIKNSIQALNDYRELDEKMWDVLGDDKEREKWQIEFKNAKRRVGYIFQSRYFEALWW